MGGGGVEGGDECTAAADGDHEGWGEVVEDARGGILAEFVDLTRNISMQDSRIC